MLSALQKLDPAWQPVNGGYRHQYQRNAYTRQRPVTSPAGDRLAVSDEQQAVDREEQADPELYYYCDELHGIPSNRALVLPEDQQEAAVKAMVDFGRAIIICAAMVAVSIAVTGFAIRLHQVEQQLAAQARV